MDTNEILVLLQDHLRKQPTIVVGTGLSISMALPGMEALKSHLHDHLPIRLPADPELAREWNACQEAIGRKGLEEGLSETAVSPILLELIVEVTADFVEKADIKLRDQIFSATPMDFPFAKLLKHLFKSLPPGAPNLNVITPNYDHVVEYACDIAKIPCNNGFSGFMVGSFDESELTKKLYVRHSIVERNKPKVEHREYQLVRLLKPHGSLHWQKCGEKMLQCREKFPGSKRVIITPGLTKYESSLTDPVMNYHREAANQCLRDAHSALIIGFGFNDSHLQTVLTQKLADGLHTVLITRTLSDKARKVVLGNPQILALEHQSGGGSAWHYQGKSGTVPEEIWDLKVFVEKTIG